MKSKLGRITLFLVFVAMILCMVVACDHSQSYTITVMDGETAYAFDVASAGHLSEEAVLEKLAKGADYEFVGLFKDEALTEAFVFEDEILGDITLYAKYTQKDHYLKVKYVENEPPTKIIVKKGGGYLLDTPEREGFDFVRFYYIDDDGDATTFAPVGTYDEEGDLTVFVEWRIHDTGNLFQPEETPSSDTFIVVADQHYYKERASASDEWTYVFLTDVTYTFGGYKISTDDDGGKVEIRGNETFIAKNPGTFRLTAVKNDVETTVSAKVVCDVMSIAMSGDYTAMLANAGNESIFQKAVAASDYVIKAPRASNPT